MAAYWRLLDLSLSQLTRGRRLIVIVLLAAVPPLVAGFYLLASASTRPDVLEFHDEVMNRLLLSAVLPIVVLLLSTAALGDEVEDRTLGYLVLKPISRWSITLAKVSAGALIAAAVLTVSAIAASLMITEGSGNEALATLAGLLVAVVGYGAVFTWTGLVTRHALPFGLVYVFLWEATLSSLFTGIGFLSVRQYALATTHGLDSSLFGERGIVELSLAEALVSAVVVTVLFAWLTTRRLRLMDVP